MDLREVAGELYGSASAEFVQRRSEAAAGADRALAKEIRAFRKPTASAAAINALVRERPDAVEDVLDIGDRMREAFADRDRQAIRELTRERQRLLQKATQGLGLSSAVEREVEETLQAAVVDPAAAAAVRSGMLLRALESTGVEEVDVSDAVALPIDVGSSAAPRPTRRKQAGMGEEAAADAAAAEEPAQEERESASERRERQRRIRTAEKALERARDAADGLDDELDAEVDRRTDLEGERETLERRLERTTEELAEARAAERDLRKRIAEAAAAIRAAERELREARGD